MNKARLTSFIPKKILVCQLRQLGDVILATPSFEILKKKYPQAELHVLTEKKCVPLLEQNPYIYKIWSLDKTILSSLIKELLWYWNVAQTNFDLIVDFQQLPRCRWIVAFSRAPVKLTYAPPWYTKILYTHFIKPIDGYSAMSKASILRPLGIHWNGEQPCIYLTSEEKKSAQNFLITLGLKINHFLITIDPTHKQKTRRWPIKHYIQLMKDICNAYPSTCFLLLWGPGEYEYVQPISACKELQSYLLLPKDMLTLRTMAACIHKAQIHIGNCSAPRHIAVAVNTPSFTILGSTSSAWTFPSTDHNHIQANISCQPCNHNTCSHIKCLNNCTPQSVFMAIRPMLQRYLKDNT